MALDFLSKDLLEAAPDAMVVVDTDGRIIFVNSEAIRLFGYERDELLAGSIERLLPAALRSGHIAQRAAYFSAPRLRPMGAGRNLVALRRNGEEFPVEISLSPLRPGSALLVIASIRDISERRRLEAEKDELLRETQSARLEAEKARELIARVNAITDVAVARLALGDMLRELLSRVRSELEVDVAAVLLLDERQQVLRVRAAVGYDEADAATAFIPLGQGFAGRVAAQRQPIALDNVEEAEIINPALRASRVRSLLGVPLSAESELLGVLDVGTRRARAFTADDILMLQLVADRVGLAIKRAQLYEAEQQARVEAEASLRLREDTERLKDELTSMVVHDLKNPVSGISMMVQLSLRKASELPPSLQERLRQIGMTCGEMMRLIQNLLEISKMEEGKMPIEREIVPLQEVVSEVVLEYRPMAEQMSRRLHGPKTDSSLQAMADRALLKRVLINLVVNALRHSGSVDVWIEVAAEADTVALRVIDQGRGIDDGHRARIFEKFAVVRRSVGDPSGDTGLGLPFCKMASERMGGRIALESHPTATQFTVTLPRAVVAAGQR